MIFRLKLSLVVLLFCVLFLGGMLPFKRAHAHDFAWGRTSAGVDRCFPAENNLPIKGSKAVSDENCPLTFTWGQFTLARHTITGAMALVFDASAPWRCYYTDATTDRILSGRNPLDAAEETQFCRPRQYTWATNKEGEDRCYLAHFSGRPVKQRPALSKEEEIQFCEMSYEWGEEQANPRDRHSEWRCYPVDPKTKHALRAIHVDEETRRRTLGFRDPVTEGCSKRKPKHHDAALFDARAERDRYLDPVTSTSGGKVYFTWGKTRDGVEHCYQSTHSQRGDRHPYVNTSAVADEYCDVRYLWGQDHNRQWRCYVTKDSGVPLDRRPPIDDRYCPRSCVGQAVQGFRGLWNRLF